MDPDEDKRSYYTFPSRLYNFQREMKRRAKKYNQTKPQFVHLTKGNWTIFIVDACEY